MQAATSSVALDLASIVPDPNCLSHSSAWNPKLTAVHLPFCLPLLMLLLLSVILPLVIPLPRSTYLKHKSTFYANGANRLCPRRGPHVRHPNRYSHGDRKEPRQPGSRCVLCLQEDVHWGLGGGVNHLEERAAGNMIVLGPLGGGGGGLTKGNAHCPSRGPCVRHTQVYCNGDSQEPTNQAAGVWGFVCLRGCALGC